MQMEDSNHLSPLKLPLGMDFVPYTDSMIEEVTKLVYRSVEGPLIKPFSHSYMEPMT